VPLIRTTDGLMTLQQCTWWEK